jgi:hypothetical protein
LVLGFVIAGVQPAVAQDDSAWAVQKTTAADGGANSYFGSAAAVLGSTAVIGADGDATFTGAAYVMANADGAWTQVQKLTPDDGAHGDEFGYRVALSADTLAITSYSASPGGNTAQGAAYVFNLDGGAWTQSQKLLAADGVAFDDFGASAQLEGSSLFIGANGATVGANAAQGALYVFANNGGSWSQTQKLISDDGAAFDNFGFSVAVNKDTMFVGAPSVMIDGVPGQGAVYRYALQDGQWTQVQKLVAADANSFGAFGESVAFDGTRLLVGASGANAVYAFGDDGSGWSQRQKFSGDDTVSGDNFGAAVALSGSEVLVAGDVATVDGFSSRGAAYLFSNGANGWTQTHKFIAEDGTTDDFLGAAIALDGDTAIVASPHPAIDGNTYQGAAYFFTRDSVFVDGFDG